MFSLHWHDPGGVVELECTIRNGRQYDIMWMRLQSEYNANSLRLSNGSDLIIKERRFKVKYNPESGSYKLTISEVRKSDEGKYQCKVNSILNFNSPYVTCKLLVFADH